MARHIPWFVTPSLACVLVIAIVALPDPDAPSGAVTTREGEFIALRATAKLDLARDVAAGRRTLVEAATLVAALNRRPPAPTPAALSDDLLPPDELACREVIDWVTVALGENPGRQAATVSRLEAEWTQTRNLPGGVQLCDPDPAEVDGLLTAARSRLATVRIWASPP
jgi:hypothetical protein